MNKYILIIRRRFYHTFRKKDVEESLKKRKGKCRNCSCCEVKICGKKYNCRYFNPKTKLCLVYGTDKMPTLCNNYPFDEKDKWPEYKDKCGFYWEKDDKKDS